MATGPGPLPLMRGVPDGVLGSWLLLPWPLESELEEKISLFVFLSMFLSAFWIGKNHEMSI